MNDFQKASDRLRDLGDGKPFDHAPWWIFVGALYAVLCILTSIPEQASEGVAELIEAHHQAKAHEVDCRVNGWTFQWPEAK